MQSPATMFPALTKLDALVKSRYPGYKSADYTCDCCYMHAGGTCENCDLAPAIIKAAGEMTKLRSFPTHPYYHLLLSSAEEIRNHPLAGDNTLVAQVYKALKNAQLKVDADRAAGLAAIAAADAAAAAWADYDAAIARNAAAGGGGAIALQV